MKNKALLLCMALVSLCLVGCSTQDSVAVKESTGTTSEGFNEIHDSKTGMYLRWKFTTDNVTFEVAGETTGWVAVGFDPSSKMNNSNIIIGYVHSGVVTVSDDFGSSVETHAVDTSSSGQNNLSAVTGNETAGWTTIRFTIPKDSGDAKDKALASGQTHVVMLAKSSADDLTTAHTSTNSGRTSFSLKL